MIDYNNNDSDLWNYVTKTTKKIDSNNNSNHHKNINKKKKKEVDLTPKFNSQNIYPNNNKKTIIPIHFSKDNNASGLSKKNIKEIKTGKFKVESKLDLHGYKLREAEILFFEFIKNCFTSNKRNIMVISGKGEHGKGKIKLSIPVWIASSNLSSLIYFYSSAALKDGGDGAYYIRLRKKEIVL